MTSSVAIAPARPAWLRAAEGFGVIGFALVFGALGLRLARAADPSTLAAAVVLAAPLGWLAADFATGFVHWFCDRTLPEHTPVVGPLLIAPFREHHRDPEGITRHDFLEVSGYNALGLLPVLGLGWLLPAPEGHALGAVCAQVALVAFALAAFGTNQFHKWAHSERVGAPVAWLQRAHLVLPREHHALHHRGAHDRAYCVTNGCLNPLLDRVRFFARLERFCARLACALGRPDAGDSLGS